MNIKAADIIRQKFSFECPVCLEQYNNSSRFPMIICPSQHSVCQRCIAIYLFKSNETNKCPQCQTQINKKNIIKFRFYNQIRQIFEALKKQDNRFEESQEEINILKSQLEKQKMKISSLMEQAQEKDATIKRLTSQLNFYKEALEQSISQQNQDIQIRFFQKQTSVAKNKLQQIFYLGARSSGWAELMSLSKIDFDKNVCLTQLPQRIENLSGLIQLSICRNNLLELPTQIGSLHSLQKLYLFGNKLKKLPASIGRLQSLIYFSVYDNFLTYLPDQICQLRALQFFRVQTNRLEMLPRKIGQMSNLSFLYIYENPIKEYSETFGELNLIEIQLSIDENSWMIEKFPLEKFKSVDNQNRQMTESKNTAINIWKAVKQLANKETSKSLHLQIEDNLDDWKQKKQEVNRFQKVCKLKNISVQLKQ